MVEKTDSKEVDPCNMFKIYLSVVASVVDGDIEGILPDEQDKLLENVLTRMNSLPECVVDV